MLDECGKLPHRNFMSKSIRVSDDLIDRATKSARVYHRSPPQQIEFWARIGCVMESTLSWPVLEQVAGWGTENDIDTLIGEVNSPEGREKARRIIGRGSGEVFGVAVDGKTLLRQKR